MLWMVLMVLTGFSLVRVLGEKTTFYRDLRFWLIVLSLVILILTTLYSFPY